MGPQNLEQGEAWTSTSLLTLDQHLRSTTSTFRHGDLFAFKHLGVGLHHHVVNLLHLNIKANVTTTTRNQHFAMVTFLRVNIKVWVSTFINK